MSTESCILTTREFTILEMMRERRAGRDDPLEPILKRKLESAIVMFREDVPGGVATLNSSVTFSVDGRDPATRVISQDRMASPAGKCLPITTTHGLALLGLSEGAEFVMVDADGAEERITLYEVHSQPEVARWGKEAGERVGAASEAGRF